MTEYVAKLKPVLLGPKVLKGMWKAPHSWSKARLLSAWGDMPTVDSIDQSKSREAKRAREWFPMSRFVKEHIDEAKNSGVPSDTTQPPYFLELSGNVLKFMQDIGEIGVFNYSTLEIASFLWFLGPAFSGAPNHYHGHALNILVYGAKRWFLTPPPHARYDLKSGWEWYRQDYPTLKSQVKIYECTQYEAEVLYVPHSWGHVIVNTRTSIGYAGEFKPFLDESYSPSLYPELLMNSTGRTAGRGEPRWGDESPVRGKVYEALMMRKSQWAVGGVGRSWGDVGSLLLGRDFL